MTSTRTLWRRHPVELFKLLRDVPDAHRIFLRREYDKFGSRLSVIARVYRQRCLPRTRIVAVVGSLGKTTTQRALQTALDCPDRNFSYSNYGSSLAENLLRIRPRDAHAVLEAGVDRAGRMASYAQMIRPNLVVVTSIKSEHNRSFPTLFDTRQEKVKMVLGLPREGIAILNGDDPHVRWMATQTQARVMTFGLNPDSDIRASNVLVGDEGTEFDAHVHGAVYRVRSRLLGHHMVYPMLAAIAVAHAEHIDLTGAISRLARLQAAVSRMELIALPDGIRILDDSQKSAVESVHAAFDTLSGLPATRRIVVLGNVEAPKGSVRGTYRELGVRLARCADLVICVGADNLTSVRAGAAGAGMDPSAIKIVGTNITEAAGVLQAMLRPGDLVLVKGAATQQLRRIVLRLLQKEVSCGIKHCTVKVRTCDVCPLLNAPRSSFENPFVSRYLEP